LISFAPADIIAVRGKGWLSDSIVKAEYGDNPPANAVSHVGMITSVSPNLEPQVTEALIHVQTHGISVTLASAQKAWLIHFKLLMDAQRQLVVNAAQKFSGAPYGWADLPLQLLDHLTGSNWWTRKLAWFLPYAPICSFVDAAAMASVGVNFGTSSDTVAPSDIMNYSTLHTEQCTIEELK